MVGLLGACLILDAVWRLAGARNPWPARFLRGVGRIAGLRVTQKGSPAAQPLMLLANHVSWIDIAAIAGTTGSTFVAHDGLAIVPLIRWLCRRHDTVFVARHERGDIARQVARVRDAIGRSGALTVFPEGTTSDGTALLPFKSSLLSAIDPPPAGVSIQPVLLDYGTEARNIAWVGDEPGTANFLRILARSRPVALTLHFLEPLAGDDLAGRKSIAAGAQRRIVTALAEAQSQRVAL